MNIMVDGRSVERAERYDKYTSISVTQNNRSLGVSSWVILYFRFNIHGSVHRSMTQ